MVYCLTTTAMATFINNQVVRIFAVSTLFLLQSVDSQIPAVCTDAESLWTLTCCPNQCGANEGRGECAKLDLPNHSMTSTDVRENWPHYFTQGCKCNGNYGGYDCSVCKYGYYGTTCNLTQVLPRKSIQQLTEQEWREYIEILKMARTYQSDYKIVLEDDDCTKVDYAHEGTGFPTWHRQYILWFEWEIQRMLRTMGHEDYHTFRTHFWDWRREIQMTSPSIFQYNRLGGRQEIAGQSHVYGSLSSNGWNTICWYGGSGGVIEPKGTICDPNINTGPLLRCPSVPSDHINPCNSSNDDWPTIADVNSAINKPDYDTDTFDKDATADSFRNFMEGFDNSLGKKECAKKPLCKCEVGEVHCEGDDSDEPLLRRLHNSVHIIVGIGSFDSKLKDNKKGVMANVAASPNDPIFINHHTMIDCILERWLQGHPGADYPSNIPSKLKGHQKNGYIVPFYPLFKHNDMFKTANNFGYSCNLPNITVSGNTPTSGGGGLFVALLILAIIVMSLVGLFIVIIFFLGLLRCCGCFNNKCIVN